MWEDLAKWASQHGGRLTGRPGSAGRLVYPGDPDFEAGGLVDALFFSELERDGTDKTEEKLIERVNLGLVWARVGSPVCVSSDACATSPAGR